MERPTKDATPSEWREWRLAKKAEKTGQDERIRQLDSRLLDLELKRPWRRRLVGLT